MIKNVSCLVIAFSCLTPTFFDCCIRCSAAVHTLVQSCVNGVYAFVSRDVACKSAVDSVIHFLAVVPVSDACVCDRCMEMYMSLFDTCFSFVICTCGAFPEVIRCLCGPRRSKTFLVVRMV